LACDEHSEPPKFPDGWLHKREQRYGVKKYVYHKEDASVMIDADVESQMRHMQETLVDYERCDVYNMDETG